VGFSLFSAARLEAEQEIAPDSPHRYVYLLYRQPQTEISLPKDCPSEIKEMGDRKQFDFESFVELNKLELVGVNFHTVRSSPLSFAKR